MKSNFPKKGTLSRVLVVVVVVAVVGGVKVVVEVLGFGC